MARRSLKFPQMAPLALMLTAVEVIAFGGSKVMYVPSEVRRKLWVPAVPTMAPEALMDMGNAPTIGEIVRVTVGAGDGGERNPAAIPF